MTEAVGAQAELGRLVRDALMHLYDPVYLQTHPLARRPAEGAGEELNPAHAGRALRYRLLDAIARLRPEAKRGETPDGATARAHRLLELRYVEALDPPATMAQLGIEKSQYYREHARALAALVSLLKTPGDQRAAEQRPADGATREPGPAAGPGTPGAAPAPPPWIADRPYSMTSFVGRDRELAAVRRLLTRARLLTLTGPGGVGKTRLALEALTGLAGDLAGAVCVVSLAALREPAEVLGSIAAALDVRDAAGGPVADRLAEHLRDRRLLLVLDNFEPVLAAGPAVTALLAGCPGVRALVTSREALRVAGEQRFPVPPMELPDPAGPADVVALGRCEAVALFVERAQAVDPDFALTPENAPAVAGVCAGLDGLPLAIELAAARVRHLPPRTLLSRLGRRLPLLTGGPRDAPPRQQTLQATLEWSHALLTPSEQALFRRLAVFVSGCTLEAAEAVCPAAGHLGQDLLDGLAALVDKSLLWREEAGGGQARFRMLETVREFASDRLWESGEAQPVEREHTAYHIALAERAQAAMRGPQQLAWLGRLEQEHDNLRGALQRAVERGRAGDAGAAEQGLRLAAALWRFWYVRGHFDEGRRWLAQLLALPTGSLRTAERANALNGAGSLARPQGDYATARALHQEALAIRRELGDKFGIAGSLNNLGLIARYQGDHARARVFFEEAIEINRELGNRRGEAVNLNNLANALHAAGEAAAARRLQERSVALFRGEGDEWGIAMSLCDLGDVVRDQGDAATARTLYEESLVRRRAVGDRRGMAMSLSGLGRLAYSQGDHAAARAQLGQSLAISSELGDRWGVAQVLEGLAALAAAETQPERALRLAGAAAAVRSAGRAPDGTSRPPDAARAVPDAGATAADRESGRSKSLAEVVADALADAPDPG
jgi:non-specific serine/threonine protein kinase